MSTSKDNSIQFQFNGPDEVVISGFKEATIIPHPNTSKLLVVSEKGFGKRTPIEEYRNQKRGGKGIPTMKCNNKTGEVVAGLMVEDHQDVMIVTEKGQIIRMAVSNISISGRKTQGVKLINLESDDTVQAVVTVPAEPAELKA